MSRGIRINSPNTIYHVMARGNNREALFLTDGDRETYLRLWRKYKNELEFDVYAYVLMTNHVHWLIKTGRVAVSSIVHTIHGLYARIFNQAHERVGHVFQGRFKAEVCLNDRYFLTLCRYIHHNPLEAGLVNNLLDYPWSSYPDICGKRNDSLVKREFLLSFFGDYRTIQRMRQFIEIEVEDKDILPAKFEAELEGELEASPDVDYIQENEERPSMNELAKLAALNFNITINELQGDSRAPAHVQARKWFIQEAVRRHAFRRVEVARYLKKDRSLITKVLQDNY